VEPAQDLDQRGLAGTVVPDQAEHLAAPQPQADVGERHDRAVPLGHVVGTEHRFLDVLGHQVPPVRLSRARYWLAIMEMRMAAPRMR
jgi:hypothetical protein